MLKQIEGSHAMAEAIALCRPEVICAYPITPQTHIVEGLGDLVKTGELQDCEFINVESEFAALSVAIGASAAGARAYTATASQGLLFMAEAVYNASGLGLPIVMTLGNRAIGAPINIWNDHSDAMSMRDAGWIQLFAETNQEAVDLHILAFRLAEELSMPVMVCVDGFILTHAFERVDIPDQAQVDAYLPPYDPVQVLDPEQPASIGAMVGPEAFTEVRFLAHYKQRQALAADPGVLRGIREDLRARGRRPAAALPRRGRRDDRGGDGLGVRHDQGRRRRDARGWREDRHRLPGGLSVRSRSRPCAMLLAAAKDVVVVEKSIAVGIGGPLADNVDAALRNLRQAAAAAFRHRRPGRPADHARSACTACSAWRSRRPGRARISSISTSASSAAKSIASARRGAPGRPPKTSCASSRRRANCRRAEERAMNEMQRSRPGRSVRRS